MLTELTVLVVAKSFATAKQRLAPVLDDGARARVARALLHRTLRAAAGSPRVTRLALATDDAGVAMSAAAMAPAHALDVIHDDGPALLGAIVDRALGRLAARMPADGGLVVVMADLPAVRSDDFDALADALAPRRCVVAPDRRGLNTNALGVVAADAFPTAFGSGASYAAHRAAAVRHGLEVVVVERAGLALDLDEPGDLSAPGVDVGELTTREDGDT